MRISSDEIRAMIRREIDRTLFRDTNTFISDGPLAGQVVTAPGGGIFSTAAGIAVGAPVALDTGAQVAFGDDGARAGWLICEGQAVSRATFSGLFAVVGTSYGAGDGSTTFNVPDLRGVSPIGVV